MLCYIARPQSSTDPKVLKKLAELLPGTEVVHSVYGAGYRYEPPAG